MFWKAKTHVDKPADEARLLKTIVLKTVGERFVTRLNFTDNSFLDVDHPFVPRFDRGETFTITLYADVNVPPVESQT